MPDPLGLRFSRRVPGHRAANALTLRAADRRARGLPTIDLTLSNPTRADLPYPETLLQPLGLASGLQYRPEALGLLEARQAVAADFARRGVTVDPAHLALTSSTSEAYSLLFKLLCDAGDEVLVPQPSYPLFEHLTRLDGIASVPYPLEYHGRWTLDADAVARACTPRTKAVLVVSPNNPTGSCVSARELAALADVCASAGVAIISDEVFADYLLDSPATAEPGVLAARHDVLGFTLGGLSKSVGLPQVKVGWCAVSGPPSLVADTMDRLEWLCDTYLSVSTPAQLALGALLQDGTVVRDAIRSRLRANDRACQQLVDAHPSCQYLRADGGWSAVIRVPTLLPEDALVLALLDETSVLVHPGYFFDFSVGSYLVPSLLVPEPAFRAGLEPLLSWFSARV